MNLELRYNTSIESKKSYLINKRSSSTTAFLNADVMTKPANTFHETKPWRGSTKVVYHGGANKLTAGH